MYVDTSVVAAYYLPEDDSDAIQAILATAPLRSSSEILLTEFRSVLVRKEREGRLKHADGVKVWRRFEDHVDSGVWNLLPVTRALMESAANVIAECAPVAGVRTLDAIHLAACRDYGEKSLYTADDVMKKAARHLGIPLVFPKT